MSRVNDIGRLQHQLAMLTLDVEDAVNSTTTCDQALALKMALREDMDALNKAFNTASDRATQLNCEEAWVAR